MLDGFFRTLLRELEERPKNRTPIRLVLDGRSPPSYGNLENVLKTPPSYTFCWTSFCDPPTEFGIWSKIRQPALKSVGRTPRTPLRDLARPNFSTTPLPEVQDRHQPSSYGNLEDVLKTRPSYCWTLDGLL